MISILFRLKCICFCQVKTVALIKPRNAHLFRLKNSVDEMARRQCLKASELQDIIDGWSDEEDSHPTNVVYIPPEKVDAISDEEFIDDDAMPTDQNIDTFAEIPGTFEIGYASGTDNDTEPSAPKKPKRGRTNSIDRGEASLRSSDYTPLSDFGKPFWRKPVDVKYSREAEAEVPEEKLEEVISKIGML